MYYTKKDSEDKREVFLPCKLTSSNRSDFIKIIDRFIESDKKVLILNFNDTEYIDSAGLGFMLIAYQEVLNNDKKLFLKNIKGNVLKSFDIMNFGNIFDIIDNQ